MRTGELQLLADDVRADRLEGTQAHWWRERIGDFALDEDMGQYGGQDAADKRRILRCAYLEAAFLHLMDCFMAEESAKKQETPNGR